MLAALLRAACLALVRLYHPHRTVVGRHHLPPTAAVVLVANHPNGLIDPLLLRIALDRPVRFLAKSTFFDQPLGRFAMESFGSIPVYRAQDLKHDAEADAHPGAESARPGGPGGDRRNQATFALCRAALAEGQWLALFPEGTSHSDPQLRPLKTGAARIALSAAAGAEAPPGGHDDRQGGNNGDRQVLLVPVGLSYDAKATFRSGVLLVFGAPISVQDRLDEYRRDERQAVERLTEDIRRALGEVVLESETRDLLDGVAQVAAWTSADPLEGEDAARRHQRAQALLAGYRRMRERDPDRAQRIVSTARDYARALTHLGVRDPWALEAPRVRPGRALGALARLVLTAPLALVGAALWWVPYRLAGRVAPKITRGEDDLLATVKILAGALFIGLFYAGEIVAGGLACGWRAALAVALLAPPAGYAAMRFEELAADTAEAWRQLWLRRARGSQVDRLIARRRALADEIARALDDVRSPAR